MPIHQWMQGQANISHSIRTVIRAYIQEHGYTDATCQPIEQNVSTQNQIQKVVEENQQNTTHTLINQSISNTTNVVDKTTRNRRFN